MGRHRRRSGHLQGTFPLPRIEPSQSFDQFGLPWTQPRYNQPSHPPFSTPTPQLHWQAGQPRAYGLVVAEHPTTPSTTDALSPVSTRSTLSRRSVATSTSTSYTAALGRARKFSPDADGTPSPSASVSTYHPAHAVDHASDQPVHPTVIAPDYMSGADSAMTEAVVGIDAHAPLPETAQYLYQSPQFHSPQNQLPIGQQRYPGQSEPWSGHPFRHENRFLNMEPSLPVLPIQEYRRTLVIRERGGGGRTGPLNPAQRQQTRDVRKRGACLRCAIMRERCDCGSPCANCSRKDRRKCPKYCIPYHYDWDGCRACLFPDELTFRLRKSYLHPYLQSTSTPVTYRPFQIQLNLHIDIPLDVFVMEFSPLEPDLEIRYAFQTSHHSNGQRSLDIQQNWNPPIVMWIRDRGFDGTIMQIRGNLVEIFDRVLNDPDKYVQWTEQYFEDAHGDFEAQILRLIGRYYRDDIAEHSVLRESLRLLWFEYLLINKFTIPAEAVPTLEVNLSARARFGAPRHQNVIPETINRFLKASILPGAEKAAEQLLKILHDKMFKMALSQKSPQSDRDLVLCMLLILVVFLGRAQIALFLFPYMPPTEDGLACSQEQAQAKIEEMEERVCDYLLSFHKYALSRTVATSGEHDSPSERHAREFDLEGQLWREIEDHVSEKPDRLEPGEYHLNTFRYINVRRLCWKVIENLNKAPAVR
ncbi:hypothetical protein, variant [Cladophialophora immunda]|uniref:Zn(2)-C6 fungal-type domain-containing protein n=1 Tax=Cladophialophora immunda TaxID=569365 RepID=A0A0D2AY01_9EURO|nr:hypothetical protein, variant [Cladophialophora immunda]KIW30182.1 hypothetical protein, variant [Cladophialophora immunda]